MEDHIVGIVEIVIPLEIVELILFHASSFYSVCELLTLGMVCRSWNRLIKQNKYWKTTLQNSELIQQYAKTFNNTPFQSTIDVFSGKFLHRVEFRLSCLPAYMQLGFGNLIFMSEENFKVNYGENWLENMPYPTELEHYNGSERYSYSALPTDYNFDYNNIKYVHSYETRLRDLNYRYSGDRFYKAVSKLKSALAKRIPDGYFAASYTECEEYSDEVTLALGFYYCKNLHRFIASGVDLNVDLHSVCFKSFRCSDYRVCNVRRKVEVFSVAETSSVLHKVKIKTENTEGVIQYKISADQAIPWLDGNVMGKFSKDELVPPNLFSKDMIDSLLKTTDEERIRLEKKYAPSATCVIS